MSVMDIILRCVEAAVPEAIPVIEIAKVGAPLIEEGLPVIIKAFQEGPEAYAAAKTAAPGLFAAVARLASTAKASLAPAGAEVEEPTDHEVVIYAAHLAGVDPPNWAHEATQRWWENAVGNS